MHPIHIVNPALDDYLLAHCTPADDILRDLAEETRKAVPELTTMQITQDEGALLTVLTQLTGAQLAVEVAPSPGTRPSVSPVVWPKAVG
jgi:caffeoyl-CoA O-methyltransferase